MPEYDVALSFAGEDRKYAEELAELLDTNGYSCFYDGNELPNLWGKNLYNYLSSVYKNDARYCVMFLSKYYQQKLWANHERQHAQARAFKENREYILPVRLDDTEIPGITPTIGYLDLREMTIKQVYEALDKKLSEATPKTDATDQTTPSVEVDTNEYVLLMSEDGKLYFIPFQNAHWDSTEISLELIPESPEETAFLRTLRRHINDAFARDANIAFALREDAAWVKPQEIVETASDSQNVWKVVFKEERQRQNRDPLGEMTFGSFTPEKLAEERAKRILLDKKLGELPDDFQNRTGTVGLFNEATLEMFVRGTTKGFNISASPIPPLYRIFGKKQSQFEKYARLTSILYLKLSNTVEEILQFDLKLLNSNEVEIEFKGRRHRRGVNDIPHEFEVNGICKLSE